MERQNVTPEVHDKFQKKHDCDVYQIDVYFILPIYTEMKMKTEHLVRSLANSNNNNNQTINYFVNYKY